MKNQYIMIAAFIRSYLCQTNDNNRLNELEHIWKTYDCPIVPIHSVDSDYIFTNLRLSRTHSTIGKYTLSTNKKGKLSKLTIVNTVSDGAEGLCGNSLRVNTFFSTTNQVSYDDKVVKNVLSELKKDMIVCDSSSMAIEEEFIKHGGSIQACQFKEYIYNTWCERYSKTINMSALKDGVNYIFKVFKTIDGLIVKTPLIKVINIEGNSNYKVHLGEPQLACQLKKLNTTNQFINFYKKYNIKTLGAKNIAYNDAIELELLTSERKSCVKTFYLVSTGKDDDHGHFYISDVKMYFGPGIECGKVLKNHKLFEQEGNLFIQKNSDLYNLVIEELESKFNSAKPVFEKISETLFTRTHEVTRKTFKRFIYNDFCANYNTIIIPSINIDKKRFDKEIWFRVYELNDKNDTLVKTPLFKTFKDEKGEIKNEIVDTSKVQLINTDDEIDEDSEEIEMINNDKLFDIKAFNDQIKKKVKSKDGNNMGLFVKNNLIYVKNAKIVKSRKNSRLIARDEINQENMVDTKLRVLDIPMTK